jgi:hypothetical protein
MRLALLVLLACAQLPALGATQVQSVIVSESARPARGSYRQFLAFMDAFKRSRGHAPEGQLRFQFHLRPGVAASGVKLRLMGEHTSLDVPVDADASFAMPRDPVAEREHAEVRIAVKGNTWWSAFVRSPGVAPGTQRLGDLRATCELYWWHNVRNESAAARWQAGPHHGACDGGGAFFFTAPGPVKGVRLQSGERDVAIAFRSRPEDPRKYAVPLEDASWGDDTVVVIE